MTHREGRNIYLIAEQGEYFDFGSGKNYKTRPDCELILDAPDGIALLWKQQNQNNIVPLLYGNQIEL